MAKWLIGVAGLFGLAGLTLLVAWWTAPLAAFNALMPKDSGGARVASTAYGPLPRQGLDVYAPTTPGNGTLPVVVFFYGGSWNSGFRAGYAFLGRALAARGFVVVIPDYRLVPQVRYPAFLDDNAAAVRWTFANIARFHGDPARVTLMGHSAGAYNAAMLALDPRWLGAQRTRLRGLIGLAGPYDFLPLDSDATRAGFGGADDLPGTQPVNHVSAAAPPALLATADDDDTVRPRNSDQLTARLTAAGVAVERVRYRGIGHIGIITAFAQPLRWRAPVLDDAAAFARRVSK